MHLSESCFSFVMYFWCSSVFNISLMEWAYWWTEESFTKGSIIFENGNDNVWLSNIYQDRESDQT